MKLLVTGAGGMLGTDICADAQTRGYKVIATDFREGFTPLDITDTKATLDFVKKEKPDAIIHCAAWTNVDGAEANAEAAYKVNALGSWNIAAAAAETNTWTVAISTDFVFDGTKGTAYTEFDPVNPISVYGASKEAGERLVRETLPSRHMIARTAFLYGIHGKNIVASIQNFARTRPELTFVTDQIVSPTHTRDLSRKIFDLLESPLPGTYHITNIGQCTLHEFAKAIVHGSGLETPVLETSFAEYNAKYNPAARRPMVSPLRHQMLEMRGMDDLLPWHDALLQYLTLAREKETKEG